MARFINSTQRSWIDASPAGPFLDAICLNEWERNWRELDALVQATAAAIQNDPPSTPADGQVYVVGPVGTGLWSANSNAIARWNNPDEVWEFSAPQVGWTISVGTTRYAWDGSTWSQSGGLSVGSAVTAANFGTNGTTASSPKMTASNAGLASGDGRGVGWRGGLFFTDAFWGLSQDGNNTGTYKPFILATGVAGGTVYKMDPLDGSFRHRFAGNMSLDGSLTTTWGLTVASSGNHQDILSWGNFVVQGTTRITSGGGGRFSSLRSVDLPQNAVLRCTDGVGSIGAGSITDDGNLVSVSKPVYIGSFSGVVGGRRIGSGVSAGRMFMISGQDVTDVVGFTYLDLGHEAWSLGFGNTSGPVGTIQSDAVIGLQLTNPNLAGSLRIQSLNRSGSLATGGSDLMVRYTGSGGHAETLPAATGSGRVLVFKHHGSAGTWSIQAAGSDKIDYPYNGFALSRNDTLTIQDSASGMWSVIALYRSAIN